MNSCLINNPDKHIPPIGDPKQLDTPTAQAAANISVFLDSFCTERTTKYGKTYLMQKNLYIYFNKKSSNLPI